MIGQPLDVLHDEERPAVGRRAGVEDLRDVRVIHQRERLALGLEARDHRLVSMPALISFSAHGALIGVVLLREPHCAHPALAEDAQQPVRPDLPGARAAGAAGAHGAVLGRTA